jgi:hypothetical protein
MSQYRTNRQRLTRALQDIDNAAVDLKAIGFDPEGGIGLADMSEIKDAEDRLDEIGQALRTVMMNLEPVKTGCLPKWMSMKD